MASAPGSELGPLPGGHHGLSREQVEESQRERLLAGIVTAVAAGGYKATTINQIVKAASVSSRAFYEHFESKEDCFLAAFEAIREYLTRIVSEAVAEADKWPDQVCVALRTAFEFLDADPAVARFFVVEPVTATAGTATRYRAGIVELIPFMKGGRSFRAAADLPESTEDSLLGGMLMLTSRTIAEGSPTASILPDLVDFLLSPYVGRDEAEQLARSA